MKGVQEGEGVAPQPPTRQQGVVPRVRPSSSRRSSLPTEMTAEDHNKDFESQLLEARSRPRQSLEEKVSSQMYDIDPAKSVTRPAPSCMPETRQASLPAIGSSSRRSSLPSSAQGQSSTLQQSFSCSKLRASEREAAAHASRSPASDADTEVLVVPNSPMVPRRPESAKSRHSRPRPEPLQHAPSPESLPSTVIRPFRSMDKDFEELNELPPKSPFVRPFSGNRRQSMPEEVTTYSNPQEQSALEHAAVASPGRIRASKVPHHFPNDSPPIATRHADASDSVTAEKMLSSDSEEEYRKHQNAPLMAVRSAPSGAAASEDDEGFRRTGSHHVVSHAASAQHPPPALERRPSRGRIRMQRGGDSPLSAVMAAPAGTYDDSPPGSPRSVEAASEAPTPKLPRQGGTASYVRPTTSRLLSSSSCRRSSLPEPLSAPRASPSDSGPASPETLPADEQTASPGLPLGEEVVVGSSGAGAHGRHMLADGPHSPLSPPAAPLRSLRPEAAGLRVEVDHSPDTSLDTSASASASASEAGTPGVVPTRRRSPGGGSPPLSLGGRLSPEVSTTDFLTRTMASQRALSRTQPQHSSEVLFPHTDRPQPVIDFKSLTLSPPTQPAAAQ